jgi:hypothetical protein
MRRCTRAWGLVGLLLASAIQWGCESTGPVAGCIKCRCECQSTAGTRTTTFESSDAQGLLDLDCTPKGACVAECTRIGAPTPLSANCLAAR